MPQAVVTNSLQNSIEEMQASKPQNTHEEAQRGWSGRCKAVVRMAFAWQKWHPKMDVRAMEI